MTVRAGLWRFGFLALAAAMIAGCGSLRDAPPTPEPIFVTATDDPLVLPIVATETPSITPEASLTVSALLPTPDLSTRAPTPTRPAPITMTPTFTPTMTDTPGTPGGAGAYGPVGGGVDTVLAGGDACETIPEGVIGAVFQSDPNLQSALGCPLMGATVAVSGAHQSYQNGLMLWVSSVGTAPQPAIYALLNDGTYQRLNDTFIEGVDPESVGSQPPEGFLEPQRGFGKAWRDNPPVRDRIGWASSPEMPTSAQVLPFERGEMVRVDGLGQTFVFVSGAPGTWTAR
ncbi:MAG: hypothetical protein GX613_16080 [Chloroflexi bacterium]|nr:hypothetical protein [Chloroflexota bacterium]